MSDSTPLLADVDGVDTKASDLKLDAEAELAAPLAFRMPAEDGPKHAFPINARGILLLLSLVLVEAIWTVFVVMLVFVPAFGILIPVAVSTVPSAVILGLLLYAGRRHHTAAKANGDKRPLRRNINQIRVLMVLGTSWLVMAILTALFVPLLCAPLFLLCLIRMSEIVSVTSIV
ncbi:unnamed protein product, partial [Mycena citricolor]